MKIIVLVLSLGCVGACDSIESTELANDDLLFTVRAEMSGDTLDVVAHVTTDNEALLEETFVDLAPEDRLVARVGNTGVDMTREYLPILNVIQYRAELPAFGGETLEVDLRRDNHPDLDGTSVQIPWPFEITNVPDEFSRGEGVAMEWEQTSASETHVSMDGSCLDASLRLDGNPGRVTVSPSTMNVPDDAEPDEACDVTITITTEINGSVASEFGRSGTIRALRARSTTAFSTP